ncbi:MAG TPA: sensor histidine kinase [Bacteroidales bacterium]|nr:sensor histidine kinase [Bacteroidales bacterium]
MADAKNSKNSGEKQNPRRRESSRELRSLIDGQEIERQRLSRELHDGIGQSLIAIRMQLDSLSFMEEQEIKDSLDKIQGRFDRIIDEIRRISTDLAPAVLDEFGIVIALRNLCLDTGENARLKIHFEFSGEAGNLGKKVATYLYRIVQEALHNIVKHAQAGEVWVRLDREKERIRLTVRDDGKGFDVKRYPSDSGHGLQNIRDRVKLLQGKLELESGTGKGTLVSVLIPLFP